MLISLTVQTRAMLSDMPSIDCDATEVSNFEVLDISLTLSNVSLNLQTFVKSCHCHITNCTVKISTVPQLFNQREFDSDRGQMTVVMSLNHPFSLNHLFLLNHLFCQLS